MTPPPPANLTTTVVTTTASVSTAAPASPALQVTTTYTPLPEALGITALGVAVVLRRLW
jgi:hypothetical protein